MDPKEKLKKNQNGIKVASCMATLGSLLLGLGLQAFFDSKGNALIDILNEPAALNVTLVMGIIIVWWSVRRTIYLSKESAEIRVTYNL